MSQSTTPKIELRKVRHNVAKEKFDSFDVWIDSKFYCSTRYSDFYTFSEKIAEEFKNIELPKFPPKKLNIPLLGMNEVELEERRAGLDLYMKKLFEIPELHDNPVVKKFFFEQREIFLDVCSKEVEMKVHLMDDSFVSVKVKNSIKTDELLKVVSDSMNLPEKYRNSFALFDIPNDSNLSETKLTSNVHPWYFVRRQEFMASASADILPPDQVTESILTVSKTYIKKWVFSPHRFNELIRDQVAVKLLYLQAQADLKSRLLFPSPDEKSQLRKYSLDNDMKEYLKLVKSVRGYFVSYMAPCKCNHPVENSMIMLGLSVKGIELHILPPDGKSTGDEEVLSFPWDKIRRWRYSEDEKVYGFHYYFTPTKDKWITCETDQYLLINNVIQEYVEEYRRSTLSSGQFLTTSKETEEKTEQTKEVEKPKEVVEKPSPKPVEKKPESKAFSKSQPLVNENKIFSTALTDDDL